MYDELIERAQARANNANVEQNDNINRVANIELRGWLFSLSDALIDLQSRLAEAESRAETADRERDEDGIERENLLKEKQAWRTRAQAAEAALAKAVEWCDNLADQLADLEAFPDAAERCRATSILERFKHVRAILASIAGKTEDSGE